MSLLLPHRRRNSGAKGAMSTERRRTGSSTTCCAVDWTTREAEVGALGLLIYQAAKEGSTEGLKFALSRRGARVHIDYRDSNTQYTPLMAAAANGHLHCVKLLLSHSADIKFSIPGPKSRSTKQTALSLADKHGHSKVAEYLQACLEDLAGGNPTRAQIESEVISIAENPKSTAVCVQEFHSKLHWLMDNCGYTLDAEDEQPSLLIRAAKADNHLIVYNLVEEFNAPTYSTHPETAENVLHFACHNISPLRFYFINRHRELLCIPDCQGNSPLHIVCSNNDLELVSWLFRGVLGGEERAGRLPVGISRNSGSLPRASPNLGSSYHRLLGAPRIRAETDVPNPQPLPMESSSIGRSSSQVHVSEASLEVPPIEATRSNSEIGLTEKDSSDQSEGSIQIANGELESSSGNEPTPSPQTRVTFTIPEDSEPPEIPPPCSPLPASFISDIRLFRKNTAGESILHILASHGHSELLETILRVAERIRYAMAKDELEVVTERDGFTVRTPIEEGLMAGNLDCVQLLIEFVRKINAMKRLFEDQDLIKVAVLFDKEGSATNIEALKMLIGYGFKTGLGKSITLADPKEQHEITRLLLFYQTQVVNSLEFATVHPNQTVSLKAGRVKWEGFNLRHIDGEWFHDANCAVDSVSRIFHDPDHRVHSLSRQSQAFFCKLGASCLSYFSNLDTPSSLERSYIVALVEINLTENHLTTLPPELFQQRHLRTLLLSHNELFQLPESGDLNRTIYDSPRLRTIDLDWNQLQTLPEEFCRGVGRSLEELNLVHNRLVDLPPGLWMMRRLRKLKLSSNRLTRLHKFSDPQCFTDPSLSQRVVTMFEASPEGELRVTDGGGVARDEEAIYHINRYLHDLMSFLKTVLVLLEKDDAGTNLAKAVIDIHWQRYNCTKIPSYEPHPPQIIDTLFDFIENEGSPSLIQRGFTSLVELHLNENCFRELPWDLPCLVPELRKLYITENKLSDMDIIQGSPAGIVTLCLSKNQIVNTTKKRSAALPCSSLLFLASMQPDRTSYRDHCTHCQHLTLENLAKLTLDSNRLERFELVNISSDVHEQSTESAFASIDINPLFPYLTFLNLANNLLTRVPRSVEKFSHLSYLNLSQNVGIRELPEEVGMLNPQVFLTLGLEGLFIKNMPHSIVKTGNTRNIICYLKSIREKSQTYRRIKLMVVGEDNKGKTSLLLSLTKSGSVVRFKEVAMNVNHTPLATNGVDLGDWEYAPKGKEKVTFMTWDFGGQEEYYATHQCFLTNRSLFLLVWNATDGEAGLRRLRFWLENIEVRARDSPVIVVATHGDSLPQANYKARVASLQGRLRELYSRGPNKFAFPRICSVMHVVNCKDCKQMEQLRNYIYNITVQYCPPSPTNLNVIRPPDLEPLLEQKVPETFVKLQDIVRRLALSCSQQNRAPILSRQEYLAKVRESGEIHASNDELDQATSFLHSNGILIHYTDSQLSDLYFVDPQWLCSTLANVITIRERNPHVKDGIVSSQNLNHILRGTSSSIEEIISVMRKFEVMFKLDEERHLIPSLLPLDEANPFIIMPQSAPHISNDTSWGLTELRVGPPAPISSQPDILIRYLCLPFTPNGFFPRLIAQVMNSDLATQIQASLTAGPLDSAHLLNQVHWEAWRTGMSLVWNHMEILRIAPLSWPLPHSNGAAIISSLPLPEERETLQGMEIMVAVLPEDRTLCCPILPPDQPHDSDSCSCNKSRCMATWILQKVTDLAEIVMEDWYEVFGFRRNLNNLLSCMTSPCPHCFKACHDPKKVTSSENGARSEPGRKLYMFTLPYCSLNSEGRIACPDHGVLEVAQVAPDLVFADFAPAALIPNKDVKLLERLGEGGFAKVYQGLLTKGTEQMKVAVKELVPSRNPTDLQIPELEPEKRSWAVYHEASVEARMMYQLNHPHILTLMGITLHPIRLVLELAREDLASTVVRYQKKNKRFSRRTIRATLTQIADAMAYLHSRNILFRDLKPGNVLVWDFPLPREQWNPDAQILVKVADYGISKQISPQGIHSKAGTPQYLPPEVLLNSEHEAASLKVDVYSFGMVMYYLFSFGNPFGSSLLVGSQLRHSRRPELQTKHWPNSVQMVELMAWCWSDKPRHRPSFEQILSIIRGETIYSLVGGLPLGDVEEVHAAAVKTIAIPHRRHSSTFSPPASVQGQGQSCLRLSSIIPARACGIGMGTGIEVWYGTIKGTLKMVRYHSTGTFVKAITHNSTKYISSIVIVSSNVWVGTIGEGLWVYDSVSRQLLAMWGETEEEEVYQLIQVESTVLALTGSGMYLFTAELSDSSQTVTILDPLLHRPCSETQNTVGVYIPRMSDVTSPEVWACAQKGEWVQVLYPNDLSVRVEVEIPSNQNKKIRHMVTTVVGEKCCVFLADWHMLLKYEVKSRQRAGSVDCHTAIWRECHSTHIETQLKQAQVTSLVAGDDGVLYVGNKVGKILLVKTDTLEVISRLDAYEGSVRSLKMVPMSEAFSRMISSFKSIYSLRGQMSTTPSSSSIDSVFSPSPLSSTPATPTSSEQHSVLLSFGVGYKGVVAGATNHPDGFLLPHGLTQCPCCTHFLTQPRPVPSSTHLLLWSREAHPHGGDVDGREGDHLDGSSE